MTLIAAYEPFGVPVLIGDFLITGGQLSSTRKKIYKVSSNFVIGWTGNVIDARPLMKLIFEKFENETVSLREVEKFLTSRTADPNYTESLHLVGWIIEDDNRHCFLWNIAYPDELFFERYHTAGTGGETFKALITRDTLGITFHPQSRTNTERAIRTVLSKAAELYADEMLDKINRKKFFGHGYELLYFDGSEFRYLENIAFSGLDAAFDSEGKIIYRRPYDLWYRYHSLGDAAFLQINDFKTGDIILESIEPVFRKKMRDAAFEFTAGSLRANYYCLYFRFQNKSGKESYTGSYILPETPAGPSRYEKVVDGKWAFVIENDVISDIYRQIKVGSKKPLK